MSMISEALEGAATGPLGAGEYDAAEARARARTANRIVESFQPVTFVQVGYPVRVEDESELWKFVDVMHERRFEHNFVNLLEGLDEDEFRLFHEVNRAVSSLSERAFGCRLVARGSLLRAINVLRHIRYIHGDARPPILEVGAGSGYLGAMLILEGYPYVSTDVAQGFYLYQSLLFETLAPGRVRELAREETPFHGLPTPESGEVVHIPWWRFYDPSFALSAMSIDLVTCNHAFCEMHPRSLYYLLLLSRHVMQRTQPAGAFVFEGWGSDVNLSLWYTNSRFYRYGYAMAHNDARITVFADAAKSPATAAYPRLDMTNFDNVSQIREFGGRGIGEIWDPIGYGTPENPFSRAILEGRQTHERAVGIDRLALTIAEFSGEFEYETEDERFWRQIEVS